MKRWLAALAACLVLMLSTPAAYAATYTGSLSRSTYKTIYDTDKAYLTVVGVKEDVKYQQLCTTFQSQPGFVQLKNDTHFHSMPSNSPMYRARYSQDFKDFPTVRLQTPNGQIIKEWSGSEIPDNETLLAELNCLPRRRVQPQPVTPQPAVTPVPQPAITPRPRPRGNQTPFWVVVGAMGVGLAGAFWHEHLRRHG